jgi:dTDP-4-amino-4,6-dideoxygalactose transaminase
VKIPALRLDRARDRIADEVATRWRGVIEHTAFVLGPEVATFEQAFAEHVGAAGCVGVANGTDALVVALRALELAPDDEVIVPAFSFFATAEAVVLAGGTPVYADVEPTTLNLSAGDAESRVTERTVGVIGVHLYGRPFDHAALDALCRRHGLWLVEDAAQAHGATWHGRPIGTLGSLACWSFYPTKNLGAWGDAGAVTGPDAALLERVRRLANHGQVGRYQHAEVGTNSRLDSLQAAVLNCRLPHLEADNWRRREIACRYRDDLDGVGDLVPLQDPPETTCVYHQLTVRTARRDALAAHLAERGIGSAVHYPAALHTLPASAPADGSPPPSLPVAEASAREVLCLPMFPELTDDEVDQVCAAIRAFFG